MAMTVMNYTTKPASITHYHKIDRIYINNFTLTPPFLENKKIYIPMWMTI